MGEAEKAQVLTFGGIRARNAVGGPVSFRTRKTASLLGHLASNLGKEVPRESLCSIFWPDAEEAFARNSLSVALAWLRRQFDSGNGSGNVLASDNHAVSLSYDFVWCDAVEFQRRLKKARLVESEAERLAAFFDALELYDGPFLAGDEEDWARLERYRLEQAFHQVLCHVLDSVMNESDIQRALSHSGRALAWDPKQPDVLRRVNALRERVGLSEDTGLRKSKRSSGSISAEEASLLKEVQKVLEDPLEDLPPTAGETLGGAVPLSSRFYIERDADKALAESVGRHDSIVLIKGPRQIGKSSLLARGISMAKGRGSTILITDFQSMDRECLASTKLLYLWIISMMIDQLGRSDRAESFWEDHLTPAMNLERFMRTQALADGRLIFWGLDEVDRTFECAFRSDFFGLLRSWHNRRAMEPDSVWNRLSMAITYATEAHFLITDLNQSPFNVGVSLELKDFDLKQVAELNQRYGNPLGNLADLKDFYSLVEGHPFLVRTGLHAMASGGKSLASLANDALREDGPFADHLRRLGALLDANAALQADLKNVMNKRPLASRDSFYRLRSAGLVRGSSETEAQVRCGLYLKYFRAKAKSEEA